MIEFSNRPSSLKVECVLLLIAILVATFIDILPLRIFLVLFICVIVLNILLLPRSDLIISDGLFKVTRGARIFGYREENYELSEISQVRFHNERRRVGLGYPVNSGFEIYYKGNVIDIPVTGLIGDQDLLMCLQKYSHIKIINDVKALI